MPSLVSIVSCSLSLHLNGLGDNCRESLGISHPIDSTSLSMKFIRDKNAFFRGIIKLLNTTYIIQPLRAFVGENEVSFL